MRLFGTGGTAKYDPYWKTIYYVQTCVSSKVGFGKEIVVDFYAPLDLHSPNNEIKYDYKSLGDDVQLLETNEYKFCYKQCYKMCYYVQKMHMREILKMRCEFIKDDKESIWFRGATDIITRKMVLRNQDILRQDLKKQLNEEYRA